MMYHNPDTMHIGCDEIADCEAIGTDKQDIATQINEEGNSVIWCIGRTQRYSDEDNFYLYQRIDSPTVERGDEYFDIYLVGTPRFPEGQMVNITKKPYFSKIKKLLHFGVQPVYDDELIQELQKEFVQLCRRSK